MNYIKLSTRQFVIAPDNLSAAETLLFMYRTLEDFDVQFLNDLGVVQDLAATGVLSMKAKEKFDTAEPLAKALTWTKTGTGPDTYYTFALDTFTAGLQAALIDNSIDTDDVNSIEVEFQVSWALGGKTFRTLPFPTAPKVYNSLDRDDEDPPPTGPADPEAWLAARALLLTTQTLTDAAKWVVLGNLGWTYSSTLGGITIKLASGASAFIPLTTVPT